MLKFLSRFFQLKTFSRSFLILSGGMSLLIVGMLVVSSWGTAQAASSTNTANNGYPIKVFFSNPTLGGDDFAAVFPVDRVSPTLGVAGYAIQLLIAGPTPEERAAGYTTVLNRVFNGPSTCSTSDDPYAGPDFKLELNKKGSVPEQGTATLTFCRETITAGLGHDATITSQINATLKQFSTITKVVILTHDGHCFGDESGQDICLQ